MEDVRSRVVALLPRLRRFSFALTRDLDLADDLVQDTCERALSRLDQWEPGTRLDSWMYRIAQNLWLDRFRQRRNRQTTDLEEAENLVGEDGRTVVEGRMALASVSEKLDQLPAEQQVLIAMVCVEGLSYKEAAGILDIPIGTVMSRLARARQALHAALTEGPTVQTASTRER